MGLFEDRESGRIPVWFMRQAGRYHAHYQNIRKDHSFESLCKQPELACQVTMGPIDDFNFDAAILFSDLLFPLEQIGLGLSYASGTPTLAKNIATLQNAKDLKVIEPARSFYNFQKEALTLIRQKLPTSKNLIGFVGAPFTLFTYAVHGTHAGNLLSAKCGLYDGRFDYFCSLLVDQLIEEMNIQAEGGADTIAIFDTAVGELSLFDFKRFILPQLKKMTSSFKLRYPNKKIIYYSKHTTMDHLLAIEDSNIDALGVDYRFDLAKVLNVLGTDYFIQGNIDPCWLHLPWNDLKGNLEQFCINLKGQATDRWICGLGHGVLVGTPEENVRQAVKLLQKNAWHLFAN